MTVDLKKFEVWFVTGSQHLYGPETLAAVAEHSNTEILLMRKAARHLQQVEAIFLDALLRGKKLGILKSPIAPPLLARLLLCNWNGLGITRRIYPDNESLSELIELQLKILE